MIETVDGLRVYFAEDTVQIKYGKISAHPPVAFISGLNSYTHWALKNIRPAWIRSHPIIIIMYHSKLPSMKNISETFAVKMPQ